MEHKKLDILDLIYEPQEIDSDHVLHQESQPILSEDFDKDIYDYKGLKVACSVKEFAHKMLLTMRYHVGLGLAAVQVGVQKKIIVVDMGYLEKDGDYWPQGKEEIMINARIETYSYELKEHKEGCLSFGNIYPKIMRPKQVSVNYLDVNNRLKNFEGSNSLLIACIQHEIDHTNGIVFTDKSTSYVDIADLVELHQHANT